MIKLTEKDIKLIEEGAWSLLDPRKWDKIKKIGTKITNYMKNKPISTGANIAIVGDTISDDDPLNTDTIKKAIDGTLLDKIPTGEHGLTGDEFESLDDASKQYLQQQADYVKSGQNLKDYTQGGKLAGAALGIGAPLAVAALMKKKKKKKQEPQTESAEKLTQRFQKKMASYQTKMKREKEDYEKKLKAQQQKTKRGAKNEGFAGALPAGQRASFDNMRKKQSEVLGYKLTGANDVKVEVDDATIHQQGHKINEEVSLMTEQEIKLFLENARKKIWDKIKGKIIPSIFGYQVVTDPELIDAVKVATGHIDRTGDIHNVENGEITLNPDVKKAQTAALKGGLKANLLPAAGLTSAALIAKNLMDKKKKKKENPEESYHYNRVTKNKGK